MGNGDPKYLRDNGVFSVGGSDSEAYRNNYDKINWSSKTKSKKEKAAGEWVAVDNLVCPYCGMAVKDKKLVAALIKRGAMGFHICQNSKCRKEFSFKVDHQNNKSLYVRGGVALKDNDKK